MYLGPIQEADADGVGIVNSAVRTAWTTRVEGLRTAIDAYNSLSVESAAWRTVHVHKLTDNPSDWTWSSSTINTVDVDPVVATQRRRVR
jgi:hypothetical protein